MEVKILAKDNLYCNDLAWPSNDLEMAFYGVVQWFVHICASISVQIGHIFIGEDWGPCHVFSIL